MLTVSTNIIFNDAYLNGYMLFYLIRSNLIYKNKLATQYILGIVDTNYPTCNWKLTGVTGDQLTQITKNFLEKHPESWNYNASILVYFAIKEAYPCKK